MSSLDLKESDIAVSVSAGAGYATAVSIPEKIKVAIAAFRQSLPEEIRAELNNSTEKLSGLKINSVRAQDIKKGRVSHHELLSEFEASLEMALTQILGHIIAYRDGVEGLSREEFLVLTRELFNLESDLSETLKQRIRYELKPSGEVKVRTESKFNRTAFFALINSMLQEVLMSDVSADDSSESKADSAEVKVDPHFAMRLFRMFSLIEYSHLRENQVLEEDILKSLDAFKGAPTIKNLNALTRDVKCKFYDYEVIIHKSKEKLNELARNETELLDLIGLAQSSLEKNLGNKHIQADLERHIGSLKVNRTEMEKLNQEISRDRKILDDTLFNVLGELFKEASFVFGAFSESSDQGMLLELNSFIQQLICNPFPYLAGEKEHFYDAMYHVMAKRDFDNPEFREGFDLLRTVLLTPEDSRKYNNINCQKVAAVALLRLFIDHPRRYTLHDEEYTDILKAAIQLLISRPHVKFASTALSLLKELEGVFGDELDAFFGEGVKAEDVIRAFADKAKAHAEKVQRMGAKDLFGVGLFNLWGHFSPATSSPKIIALGRVRESGSTPSSISVSPVAETPSPLGLGPAADESPTFRPVLVQSLPTLDMELVKARGQEHWQPLDSGCTGSPRRPVAQDGATASAFSPLSRSSSGGRLSARRASTSSTTSSGPKGFPISVV